MFEVFLKELKELLRDRKTLIFVVALPVAIFPVIFALMGFLMSKAALEAEQKVHNYAIINAEYAPEFKDKLFFHKNFKLVEGDFKTVEELKQAVKDEVIDVGIVIPSDARDALENGSSNEWQIVFNDASSLSFIFTRIKEMAEEFSQTLQSEQFNKLGIAKEHQESLLNPVVLEKVDTADLRENLGEKLGALIPYLLIPLVLAGASYPAIDLGAGEKERGTLETLLLTPIPRTELVLGKFFTVLFTSLATALITVASMGVWMKLASSFFDVEKITDAFSMLGFMDFALILLLLIPLACVFSSLVLAISIYARSFKEAQNYMGPLSMLAFLPLIVAMMPNMELSMSTAMVPITNVALAIKEIIKGTVDYSYVGMIFIATAVLAGVLMAACV
ncbi:MAG: ABC transporter permease, partial [Pseudoalteromonas spongiae]